MKTIIIDAVHCLYDQKGSINQALFNLLEQFPNQKIIATNADDQQMSLFGLDNAPYPVFTLKHNPNKPNPLYFQTFMEQYLLSPKELLYIEHDLEAVHSAEKNKIMSFLYTDSNQHLVDIEQFLTSNL